MIYSRTTSAQRRATVSDQLQALHEDISFVRSIAEDSGPPYRRDGLLLVVTGLILGLAVLWSWMTAQGLLSWPVGKWRPILQAYVPYELWLVAVLVIWFRYRKRVESVAARAISATWSSFFLHFVASCGVILATFRIGHAPNLVDVMPTVLFALYGMAWWVAAAVRQRKSYRAIALGSYAAEFAIGILIGTPLSTLVFAVGLLLLVAAPGFAILREVKRIS